MKKKLKSILLRVVIFFTLIIALFFLQYRPWNLSWGATDAEVARIMAGDGIVDRPNFIATRAVTIQASPEDIWPWIIQIGYKRAGFYSYDRLDNDNVPSARRIIPEFQNLKVGDWIPLTKSSYIRVKELIPCRLLLYVYQDRGVPIFTWAWGLYKLDNNHTRLVTRIRWRHNDSLRNPPQFSNHACPLPEASIQRPCESNLLCPTAGFLRF